MIPSACPICSSSDIRKKGEKNGHTLYGCRACNIFFVFPIPTDLSKVYGQGYFKRSTEGDSFGYTDYDRDKEPMRVLFEKHLEKIAKLVPGRRLFDVGAATGYFLDVGKAQGWTTYGSEISSYAASQAALRGHRMIEGTLTTASVPQVDAVTMWDVIEHVDDPRSYLMKINSMLREGGVLALSTPDGGSWWARIFGLRWHKVVPPEHLWYFAPRNLTKLLNECGFEVLEVSKPSKRFSLSYIFKILHGWQGLSIWGVLAKKTDTGFFRSVAIPINLRDDMFMVAQKRAEVRAGSPNQISSRERLAILGLIGGSFIGIWHALPMVNVIADEMYYVGGVLRAMEAKSILPALYDVPYGTLTYYLNYVLMAPFLFMLFVLKGFDLSLLKTFLIVHPEVAYLVPRFLSGLLASIFIWRYARFLRLEGLPFVQRLAVLSVPLMTILPATIFHSGKMWVLSLVLVMGSMVALYLALSRQRKEEIQNAKSATYWSILLACAAVANFPLAGLFLIAIPILWFAFRRNRELFRAAILASFLGAGEILVVFAINYKNILYQVGDVFTNYHPLIQSAQATPLPQISFLASLVLHTHQILFAFPLVLSLLVFAVLRRAVANKLLYTISLGYSMLYILVLIFLATWSGDEGAYYRYLFPLGFFFSGMVASLAYTRLRHVFVVFLAAQIGVYLYVLFLLAVPTTFNNARNYIIHNQSAEHILIYNTLVELELPQNTESALLVKDQYCGSKCQYLRGDSGAVDFMPVVVNYQSNLEKIDTRVFEKIYVITGAMLTTSCVGQPTVSLQSGAKDANYVSIEHNLGNYFLSDFWRLSRLGRNVYVYSVPKECVSKIQNQLVP